MRANEQWNHQGGPGEGPGGTKISEHPVQKAICHFSPRYTRPAGRQGFMGTVGQQGERPAGRRCQSRRKTRPGTHSAGSPRQRNVSLTRPSLNAFLAGPCAHAGIRNGVWQGPRETGAGACRVGQPVKQRLCPLRRALRSA